VVREGLLQGFKKLQKLTQSQEVAFAFVQGQVGQVVLFAPKSCCAPSERASETVFSKVAALLD